jgi:CubicO group peptidase (beta-lactamase class C family)
MGRLRRNVTVAHLYGFSPTGEQSMTGAIANRLPARLTMIVCLALLATLTVSNLAAQTSATMRKPPPGPPLGVAVRPLNLPAGLGDHELANTLHERLTERAKRDEFSGVVLLKRNGNVIFHEGFGYADRARDREITTATAFDIGSITKLITRTAIAQLLQQGKLLLDGRIVDYLPDYPSPEVAEAVTIGHLLDHSSGLGNIFNERWMAADKQRFVQPRDFFELFADEPLQFAPGTEREYSNAGFIVLGAIVEAVSGEAYAEYVEEHIFAPAGMRQSGFEVRDGSNESQAIGYAPIGPNGELVANLGMLPIQGCAAGSSMHTAGDLLRFDTALRNGALLDPEWTAWLFDSPELLEDSTYAIGVAGGAPGVSAGLESDGLVTAIVVSNFDPPTGDALARELYAVLRGDDLRP